MDDITENAAALGGLWVRLAQMLFEKVEKSGYSGPRFKLLKPERK